MIIRNRPNSYHLIQPNTYQQQVTRRIRRKSCECTECGHQNKKMQFVNSQILHFQTYQQLVTQNLKQRILMAQQKQIKMRNKRHMNIKNAVQLMKLQEITTKSSAPIKNKIQLPKVAPPPVVQQLSKQYSISPRKPKNFRGTMIRVPTNTTFLKSNSSMSNLYQLDLKLVLKLEDIIQGIKEAKIQQNSKDDFKIGLRMNMAPPLTMTPNNQQKTEVQPLQQIPIVPVQPKYFEPIPLPEQEEDDDPNAYFDTNLLIPTQIPQQHKVKQTCYKDILKFNRRSLMNAIELGQLKQHRAIKSIIENNYHSCSSIAQKQAYNVINNSQTPVHASQLTDHSKKSTNRQTTQQVDFIINSKVNQKMKTEGVYHLTKGYNSIQNSPLHKNYLSVQHNRNSQGYPSQINNQKNLTQKHRRTFTIAQLVIKV